MSRPARFPSLFWGLPLAPWMGLASRSADTWLASGVVIAERSRRMAAMGASPSRTEQREMRRMIDEKVSATGESAQAVTLQAVTLAQTSAMRWMALANAQTMAMLGLGRMPSSAPVVNAAARASVALGEAALAPFHRRATANARRLRQR
ncbi:MAG TPA: hypothetical protein VFW82_02660 [Dyella sp.]|nr:hypothetical protein [Dyella sp.]